MRVDTDSAIAMRHPLANYRNISPHTNVSSYTARRNCDVTVKLQSGHVVFCTQHLENRLPLKLLELPLPRVFACGVFAKDADVANVVKIGVALPDCYISIAQVAVVTQKMQKALLHRRGTNTMRLST